MNRRINTEKYAHTLYVSARIDLSENYMKPDPMRTFSQSDNALLRSENKEGTRAQRRRPDYFMQLEIRQSMNTELKHLRIRMIVVENPLITLLAQFSERPRELDCEMAIHTFPCPDFIEPPRPLGRAAQMVTLVERARHFQSWMEGKALS